MKIQFITLWWRVFQVVQLNCLYGENYVEVKDERYNIHPNESIILGLPDPPLSFRTQYQVRNNTPIMKIQKVIKNDDDELVVKCYHKNKQPINQQPKFKPPNCPSCEQNIWLKFEKGR